MTPARLEVAAFEGYAPEAQAFAVAHLTLLRRLPLVVCPSFLEQIKDFDTLFPAERDSLQTQCDGLQTLPAAQFAELCAPLNAITMPDAMRAMNWVQQPAQFVTELTAHLWSSGQINEFRKATSALFAAVPAVPDATARTVVVILGQGAEINAKSTLRKLRQHGVTLTSLRHETAVTDIGAVMQARMPNASTPYTAWYVDGGELHPDLARGLGQGSVAVSYADLQPVRQHVLARMQSVIASGTGGAELMRTHMVQTTARDAGAPEVTKDPILQRFYTELFTASSGPQIFSTSFVQWTGRELARRARPHQLLLRYAPRQRRRDMNAMFAEDAPGVDAQGSLLDAEMGAYYTWLETSRITSPGKLTFLAWVEGQSMAVMLGAGAPAGVTTATPMTLAQAFENFA